MLVLVWICLVSLVLVVVPPPLPVTCDDSSSSSSCALDPTSLTLMKFNLNMQEKGREHIKIEADKSTLERLEGIKTKIAIVSIMGQARTGKSFLMNQLLASTSNTGGHVVFRVGHTVQTETEEVNMFIVPPCAIKSGDVPADTTILFLDTPGLFATNRGAVFDSQLVAVMNLISSVVLYNVKDTIPSRDLIHQLADAIHAAFVISYFDPNKASDKTIDRPYLYWVLQNLQLQNIDHEGKPQTVKSFIQELLNEVDANSLGKAGIAQEFNGFFKGMDGHMLPHPVQNTEDFDKLDTKSDQDFTNKYKEARTALRQKIYGVMSPKKLGNDFITGAMLAELIRMWIENVNIPLNAARDNSASVLLKHIEDKEVNKALDKYKAAMDALQSKYPLTDQQLSHESQQAMSQSLIGLNEREMPTLVQAVKDEITKLYKDYVSKNEHGIRSGLESKLDIVLRAHEQRVLDVEGKLPTNQAAILSVAEATENEWSSLVSPVREASAAAIPDFEMKLREKISASKQKLFSQNLQLHADKVVNNLKAKIDGVTPRIPIEQSEVDSLRNDAVASWNAVQSDMSQAEPTQLANHGSAVMSSIRDFSYSLQTKNEQTSIIECTNKARQLVAQLLSVYSGWSTWQSLSSFDGELRGIQDSDYCRGPGKNSTAVIWNFTKVRHDYAQSLHQRVMVCHVLTLLSWGLSVYAGVSLPHLISQNHWDKSDGSGSGGWNHVLYKIYPIAGAGLIYMSRLLPDAVWSYDVNYLAAAVLFVAFACGLKITLKSWRRHNEARWD